MDKKTLSKTEIRNMAVNYIIGILQNLEPGQSFDDINDDKELKKIEKEVKRYTERAIKHLEKIRNRELKYEEKDV